MSMSEDSNQPNLIEGIMVTIFEDWGPVVKFNRTPLTESETFNLAVKGHTTLGDSKLKEIFGPLPIQGRDDLQALAFLFNVQAEDTNDSRIKMFGRPGAFWLIFKSEHKRQILRAAGLIQSYLSMLIADLTHEEQLTDAWLREVNARITNLIAQARIKVYGYIKDKIQEFADDQLIPLAKIIVIADANRGKLYVIQLDPKMSIIAKRHAATLIDNLNRDQYSYKLRKVIIEDPDEANQILQYYKIESVRVPT